MPREEQAGGRVRRSCCRGRRRTGVFGSRLYPSRSTAIIDRTVHYGLWWTERSRILTGRNTHMSKSLQDRVALVTGGSRGLGAATARCLADAGADVAITYAASADKAAEVVKELEDKGVQAAAFQSDQAHAALAPQLIDDCGAR